MALINSYNHSSQLFISPVNYNTILHFGSSDRRPTSAARTWARSELNCQSTNKPDQGLGLPASAARSDLTQPRTSSRYGLMFWALSWGFWPEKCLSTDNITHKLSRYTSPQRVVSPTLWLVRIMNNTIFPYCKYVIITQFLPWFHT